MLETVATCRNVSVASLAFAAFNEAVGCHVVEMIGKISTRSFFLIQITEFRTFKKISCYNETIIAKINSYLIVNLFNLE